MTCCASLVPMSSSTIRPPDYPALEALAGLAGSGRLRVHLQAILPLAEAAQAHELMEAGGTTGKISLTL
jgi:NADPH:quinone reductase-like Zn-dependent oxidoreductase